MSTGERIKRARTEAGLSQKALAEKMGVSQQTIAKYENGERNPKIGTLDRIAKALGIPAISLEPGLLTISEAADSDVITGWANEILAADPAISPQEALRLASKRFEEAMEYHEPNGPSYTDVLVEFFGFEITVGQADQFIADFGKLNSDGFKRMLQYLADLVKISEYQR